MRTQLGTILTITQKIRLIFLGVSSTQKRSAPGWSGELMYYAFRCPVHGIVEDYLHGFNQRLRCPLCQKNLQNWNVPGKYKIKTN